MAKKHRRPLKNVEAVAAPTDPYLFFKRVLAAAILIGSIVIVYVPSLKIPFLLDDYGKIIRNPDIKSLSNIPSRLIYPYGEHPEFHRNDPSRPITYLTLTLNYHFNQLEPYGYHIVNIALHSVVVLLIFILASQLFSMRRIPGIAPPFLSALLFAVNPIHVNVVSYIIGRAASVAAAFYVFAVILYIHARQKTQSKWLIVSAVSFILALGSNQLALTLPAVILLTDFCFFSGSEFRRVFQNWKSHAPYWGLLGLYLGMRKIYFGQLGDLEATTQQVFDRMDYLRTQWVVLWKYAGMTVWPSGLSFEHLFGPLKEFSDARVLTATALYAILWAVFRRAFRFSRQNACFGIFGVLWFIITLSPTSSLFPTTATMAENRVYLPSIGLCFMIPWIGGILLSRLAPERSRGVLLITGLGAYIFFLGFMTWRRNILYQDPAALWADVARRYPDHERAHKNLALEYFKRGQFDLATAEGTKALSLEPDDLDARNNLAMVYYQTQRYNDALAAFQEIVKEKPDFAAAYANMGLIDEALHQTAAAMAAYQEAIRLNPMLIEPLNNLANIYLAERRPREAAALYQAALQIDPHNAQIMKNYERLAAYKP